MIRCITAHQLWEKYQVASPPGDVYQPSQDWWLLVTSLDHFALVSPITLIMCLDNLRTLVGAQDTLCFHLADIYRGKFSSQKWLQLIAIIFCRQAKIHILDRSTYTPESPITALAALSIDHDWSCIHMGNRPLRRTIWEDRRAVFEHLTPQPIDEQENAAGKWLITQPRTKPNYVPWITYSNADILQASGTIVLCCAADILSFSATTRYVIREYGQENIFRLKTSVGTASVGTARVQWVMNPLSHCTLEHSNLSPLYQSLQQTSTPPRNPPCLPYSPLTSASPT